MQPKLLAQSRISIDGKSNNTLTQTFSVRPQFPPKTARPNRKLSISPKSKKDAFAYFYYIRKERSLAQEGGRATARSPFLPRPVTESLIVVCPSPRIFAIPELLEGREEREELLQMRNPVLEDWMVPVRDLSEEAPVPYQVVHHFFFNQRAMVGDENLRTDVGGIVTKQPPKTDGLQGFIKKVDHPHQHSFWNVGEVVSPRFHRLRQEVDDNVNHVGVVTRRDSR